MVGSEIIRRAIGTDNDRRVGSEAANPTAVMVARSSGVPSAPVTIAAPAAKLPTLQR